MKTISDTFPERINDSPKAYRNQENRCWQYPGCQVLGDLIKLIGHDEDLRACRCGCVTHQQNH